MQLTGHNYLKTLGVELLPATAPDFFTEDTPTAVLVRQVLGAVTEFEKTSLVSKLKAARERKKAETGKCGGRKSHAERDPEVVALASNCVVFGRSRRCETSLLSSRGVGTSTSAVTSIRPRRWSRCWRARHEVCVLRRVSGAALVELVNGRRRTDEAHIIIAAVLAPTLVLTEPVLAAAQSKPATAIKKKRVKRVLRTPMTAIRSRGAVLSRASAFAVDARNPDNLVAQRRLKGEAS